MVARAQMASEVRKAARGRDTTPIGWGEFDVIDWGSAGEEFERFARAAAADGVLPWRAGYEPWDSQERFHALPARFKGFSGPVGSGKSAALVREALRLAMANPGSTGLIGAPTYPMLRDVTRRAFLDTLNEVGLDYQFWAGENRVLLRATGSQVLFRALEEVERIRGTNLAWFGVDELTYCREGAWERLEARLRDPGARELCGFGAWTPNGFDWVWQRFVSDERVGGYGVVMAPPGENKALPPDFYERLRASYDERFFAQEALGQYLSVFAGQVYYGFDRQTHVVDRLEWRRGPVMWSMDFNVSFMASVFCQQERDSLRVLDEVAARNSNTFAVADIAAERLRAARAEMIQGGMLDRDERLVLRIYGDATGARRQSSADRSDYEILRQWAGRNADWLDCSFHVPRDNPSVRDRVASVNAMLRPADGDARVRIARRCGELIKDLERVAWERDGGGIEKNAKELERTHISDALGYVVHREFPVRAFEREIRRR